MRKSSGSWRGQVSAEGVPALLEQIKGLTVALATPLNEDGEPDIGGLERLIERAIAGGASCLFPLGWAGEGPLLSHNSRVTVMRETCRLADGRVPVMAGVSEQSLPRALELAEAAKNAGAQLILSTPPFSYEIPQDLVRDYFTALASASGMPLVIYQNEEVGVKVELDTLLRLAEIPGVVGVKAFTTFLKLQQCYNLAHRPGSFAVMSGDEYLYAAALLLGIRHFTMGGPGNLCPSWCTTIYRSALDGDWDAVTRKQKRLTDFCDALYPLADTAYAAFKYALEVLGICSRRITSPHPVVTAEQRSHIGKVMADFADILDS